MWSWLFTKWSFQLPQLWGRVTVIRCSSGGVHAIAVQWTPVKWSKREHRTIIISIYLSRTDLDVEVASFVWDLKDFWPGKPVYPEAVSVDKKAVGAHSEHYVNPFWILVNIDIEHKINSNKNAGLVEKSQRGISVPLHDAGPHHTWTASWHFLESSPLPLLDSFPYNINVMYDSSPLSYSSHKSPRPAS